MHQTVDRRPQNDDLRCREEIVPTPPGVGYSVGMKPEHKTSALNRLKTVRGHLDAVIRMVDEEEYCPDIMKQVSALQGSLEGVNRVLLQNHVETCVLEHVKSGRSEQVVDELLETLRYAPSLPTTKGSS